MAYDIETASRALARACAVHHKSVGRNQMLVATAFMDHQDTYVAKLVRLCRHARPVAAVMARKWDETQVGIALDTVTDANAAAQFDSVETMVSSLTLCLK